MKSNQEIIEGLIKDITNGLDSIMKTSYPNCKNPDTDIANSNAQINNTAFELKQKTELLRSQISLMEK